MEGGGRDGGRGREKGRGAEGREGREESDNLLPHMTKHVLETQTLTPTGSICCPLARRRCLYQWHHNSRNAPPREHPRDPHVVGKACLRGAWYVCV